MNSLEPNDHLPRVLAAWKVSPPLDPNFRPAVWQRLRQRSTETWAAYIRGHRVTWSVTAGLAVVAAGWTGHALAQAKIDSGREQMVVNYLSDLDPRVIVNSRR